jgi:putative peptidoglycan lipid II flippase
MGGLLWAATHFALGQNAGLHDLAQAAALLVLIVGGMAIYGLLLSLLGVTGWREALGAIRQTPPGDLRV